MLSVGSFMTIWKMTPYEKYTDCQVSTSAKDKSTGQYVTDFSGFVRLVGKAHKKAANFERREKVKLLEFGVTTNFDRAKNKTFTNIVVFDVEAEEDDGFLSLPEDGEKLPFD